MTKPQTEARTVSARGLVRIGGTPVCIAHRGASKQAPENTIVAFRKALEQRADAIELDVRATRDGSLVCLHDATLDRTTNGSGPLAERTLEEIRKLDAGSWKAPEFAGEPVPTFAEALAVIAPGAVCTAELKVTGVEKQVLRTIAEAGAQHALIIVSFHDEALARVRELSANMLTGWIVSRDPSDDREAHAAELVQRAVACGANAISASFTTVTYELLTATHERGMPLWVWTIDSEEPMRELLSAGIDGITSNVPEVLRRVIEERVEG